MSEPAQSAPPDAVAVEALLGSFAASRAEILTRFGLRDHIVTQFFFGISVLAGLAATQFFGDPQPTSLFFAYLFILVPLGSWGVSTIVIQHNMTIARIALLCASDIGEGLKDAGATFRQWDGSRFLRVGSSGSITSLSRTYSIFLIIPALMVTLLFAALFVDHLAYSIDLRLLPYDHRAILALYDSRSASIAFIAALDLVALCLSLWLMHRTLWGLFRLDVSRRAIDFAQTNLASHASAYIREGRHILPFVRTIRSFSPQKDDVAHCDDKNYIRKRARDFIADGPGSGPRRGGETANLYRWLVAVMLEGPSIQCYDNFFDDALEQWSKQQRAEGKEEASSWDAADASSEPDKGLGDKLRAEPPSSQSARIEREE